MTKTELINRISEINEIPRKDAVLIVNGIFNDISKALLRGDRVEVRGFGSFVTKSYKSYEGKNPKTSKPVIVQPKRKPVFKVGKDLSDRINK